MAYWALYPQPLYSLDENPKGDAFAVCELPFFEEMVIPPELSLHIYDERNEIDITSYNFKQISAGEFDYFLAFECGPEAKSICGDDDEHPRLYILK